MGVVATELKHTSIPITDQIAKIIITYYFILD